MLPKAIVIRLGTVGSMCSVSRTILLSDKVLFVLKFVQYKKLAQANEEALLRVEDAHNRYKEEVMLLSLPELMCFYIYFH